jgi:NADH-quinone oxidoreductase subunit D
MWCSRSARSTVDAWHAAAAPVLTATGGHRGTDRRLHASCAEKLFEVRDYRQIIVLANGMTGSGLRQRAWRGASRGTVDGDEVPERAVWLRMAPAGSTECSTTRFPARPLEVGAVEPTIYAFRERETIQAVMEEVSGGRLHYMFNRVGGLKEEVPAGWSTRARQAIGNVRRRLPELDHLIRANETFLARTVGVGVLSAGLAAGYGVSGAVARASGLDLDLRRDEPYLAYGELTVPVVTRIAGDCHARFEVLLDQVYVSLDLAEHCLCRVDEIGGPVNVRLPKVVKPPEGHTYAWTESPLGINGYYLVSRGDKTPWRMKLRTASYANVQVLSALLPGCTVADLVPILGSMFFVVGDIDK